MDALTTVFETIKQVLGMIKQFLADLGINFEKKDDAADTE